MRDIQITVIPGSDSLPRTDGIDGSGTYVDTIAAGCPYTFFTNATDPDGTDDLTMSSNVAAAIPGPNPASFVVAGNITPTPTGTFSWTPDLTNISNTPYCFVTDVLDDVCPVNGSEIKAWCLTVVEFSALFTSTGPACVQEDVNFYSQYDYTGYSYVWDFGQDAIATFAQSIARNPAGVKYAASGAKTVILTIISPTGCTTAFAEVITINPLPVSTFTTTGVTMSKCAGDTVSFTADSIGPQIVHAWDFGLLAFPASSNIEAPAPVIYLGNAPITATHTVTNQFGCMATDTVNFTINEMPTASFSSNAPSCAGLSVDFVNTGTSGGGATYFWDLGAGATPATSTDENPLGIVYDTTGGDVKTIYLLTTLGTCTDSIAMTINVYETPVPSFTDDGPKCMEDQVTYTYTGSSRSGWTYAWDFGSIAFPSNSASQNPAPVFYLTAGTKSITLTVSNGLCSDTASATVVINEKPVANFSSNTPACTGDAIDFLNTGTSGASYAWDFDVLGASATPATSTTENNSGVMFDTSGSDLKYVQLVTTLATCTDTMIQTVNLTDRPIPSFTHTGPQCEGIDVDFTYTGSTGTGWTYDWDFGTGATPSNSSASNPPSVMYAGAGTKSAMLTVSNGVCSDSVTMSFSILTSPVADFSSNGPACTADPVDFLNTGTTGATYLWTFSTGSPAGSGLESPTGVTFASAGIKTVQLITTLGTCSDSSTQTVTIMQTPSPSFATVANTCEGALIDFVYTGTTNANWTYLWDLGAGADPPTASVVSPTGVSYTGAGSKTVMITVANGSCTESFSQTHTILEKPVASLTSTAPSCTGDSVDFANTGSTAGSWTYNWTFDTGSNPATSTDENPIDVIYSTDGTKMITLIVDDGLCSDTVTTPININLRPTANFISNTPVCAGVDVNFVNTGSSGSPWTYTWDFGAGSVPDGSNAENPTDVAYGFGGSKSISFTISDQYCSETVVIVISIDSLPLVEAGPDTTICADQSVLIGTSTLVGATYTWSPTVTLDNPLISNPTASPSAPVTVYIVTITDANGCVNEDSTIITMLGSAMVDAGDDVEICVGDSVQLGLGLLEGQLYSWSPVSSLDNASLANPISFAQGTTTYTVSISFEGCPTITDDVLVLVHPLPDVNATDYMLQDTAQITLGSSVQLYATGGMQYVWSPEAGLSNPGFYNPIASPDSTTDYAVTVTDMFGCINWDTVRVEVDSIDFFVPTAFTPDGNGFNDMFYVRIADMEDFELLIFDRWGEQIFISRSVNNGWDGRNLTGKKNMPQGAYVYSFKATMINGDIINESGLINLIR